MKYVFIFLGILAFENVQAQVPIDNLPTIFSINKQLSDSAVTLRVGMDYDTKAKDVQYYEKEKMYGNIDTLLCKYKDLLYLHVNDNEFNVDLLKCVKDSLKYSQYNPWKHK